MSGFIFGLKASRLFSVVEKFQIGSSDWLRLALSGHPYEFLKFLSRHLTKCFFCNILLSLRITVLPIAGGAKRDVIAKGAWGCVYGFGWSKDVGCVWFLKSCPW